jgi:pyrrolysine biosynthesis protein PylC
LEAAYLARQAGFETALIDKKPLAPARFLVDEFYHVDLLSDEGESKHLLKKFDFILPATENFRTLSWLQKTAHQIQVPLALDLSAYAISSSKIRSNKLFERVGIPIPAKWPDCGFPVIVKPSNLSGSSGIVKIHSQTHLRQEMEKVIGEPVVEEFLTGPSYSLEVLAHRGRCVCFQITELEFDKGYDCKRVLAGPSIGNHLAEAFYELGERIAIAVHLSGIMDIEVIDSDKGLKVLEIDARLPSQTPSAVYHSTKVNMVTLLAEYWREGKLPADRRVTGEKRAVIYEHFKFEKGVLEICGEHVLKGAQGLQMHIDRFSVNVLIANFGQSPVDWVATAIFVGDTEAQVWEAHNRAVKELQKAFKAHTFLDPTPIDAQAYTNKKFDRINMI